MFCDEADRHAAFAHSRRDHLGRPGADISHREDTRPTCFDQERASAQLLPPIAIARAGRERRTGEHESLLVEGYLATEPLGARFGPDEHDHGARLEGPRLASARILNGNLL